MATDELGTQLLCTDLSWICLSAQTASPFDPSCTVWLLHTGSGSRLHKRAGRTDFYRKWRARMNLQVVVLWLSFRWSLLSAASRVSRELLYLWWQLPFVSLFAWLSWYWLPKGVWDNYFTMQVCCPQLSRRFNSLLTDVSLFAEPYRHENFAVSTVPSGRTSP